MPWNRKHLAFLECSLLLICIYILATPGPPVLRSSLVPGNWEGKSRHDAIETTSFHWHGCRFSLLAGRPWTGRCEGTARVGGRCIHRLSFDFIVEIRYVASHQFYSSQEGALRTQLAQIEAQSWPQSFSICLIPLLLLDIGSWWTVECRMPRLEVTTNATEQANKTVKGCVSFCISLQHRVISVTCRYLFTQAPHKFTRGPDRICWEGYIEA